MPNAVNIFARALGMSTEELSKQMELGNLYAADVLPKVTKELKKFADESNELTKGSLPRMQSEFSAAIEKMQEWMNLEKPLARFYGAMTTFIMENEDTWRGFGAVMGAVMDGISQALEIITPILKTFGIALNAVFGNELVKEIVKWGTTLLMFLPIFRIFKWGAAAVRGFFAAWKGVSKFKVLNVAVGHLKKSLTSVVGVLAAIALAAKQAWDWLSKFFGLRDTVEEKNQELLSQGERAGTLSLRQVEEMRSRMGLKGSEIVGNVSKTTKTNSDNQVEQNITINTTGDPQQIASAVGTATDMALRGEI